VWHDSAALAVALAVALASALPMVISAGTVALAAGAALELEEAPASWLCEWSSSSSAGMCASAPTQPLGGKATSWA